jgi:hypothetical protein
MVLELEDRESDEDFCEVDDSSGSNNLERLLRKLPSAKNFTPGNFLSSCNSANNASFFNSVNNKNTVFKPANVGGSSTIQLP